MARGNGKRRGGIDGAGGRGLRAAMIDDVTLPAIAGGDFSLHATAMNGDTFTAEELVSYEHGDNAAGIVLALNHGGELVVGDHVNGETVGRSAAGLDGVVSVSHDAQSGDTTVVFADGAVAVCASDLAQVTCSCGARPCPHRVAALIHAARYDRDGMLSPELVAELNVKLAAYEDVREDQAALVAAAALADRIVDEIGSVMMPNAQPEPADGAAAGDAVAATGPAMARREFAREMQMVTAGGYDYLDIEEMSDAEIDAISDAAVRDEIKAARALIEQRQQTAEDLGLPIYDPDGNFVIDEQIVGATLIYRHAIESGRKAFAFHGPQGTGKNTFAYQIAAYNRLPVWEMDCSGGDDVEMWLGTTGLEPDGKGGTRTVMEIGPLTAAACAPGGAMIVLNEFVELNESQQTALYNIFGSRLGDDGGEDRFVTLKAPSPIWDEEKGRYVRAKRLAIDPNTVFVITYNPDRADRRPRPAALSRTVAVPFEYPDVEKETERIATIVWAAAGKKLAEQRGWSFDRELTEVVDAKTGEVAEVPIAKQCPELVKAISADVKMFRELREMYHQGALEHCPDTRTMASYASVRLLESLHEDEDRQRMATDRALRMLDFMWNQADRPQDRAEQLARVAANHYPDLAAQQSNLI